MAALKNTFRFLVPVEAFSLPRSARLFPVCVRAQGPGCGGLGRILRLLKTSGGCDPPCHHVGPGQQVPIHPAMGFPGADAQAPRVARMQEPPRPLTPKV